MSGGYEYNLTTQSQFQDMKQQNQVLLEQNYNLKRTLEQLIKVNNQLSQTLQQFNNSQWAQQLLENKAISPNKTYPASTNDRTNPQFSHIQYQKTIAQLQSQIQYCRSTILQKINSQQMVTTLQNLVQSFRHVQKYYDEQITALVQQIQQIKHQWQNKFNIIQQSYLQKRRIVDQLLKQLRKKQEIVQLIQKKSVEENKNNTRKLIKINSQIDTSSQRKFTNNNNNNHNNHNNIPSNIPIKFHQQKQMMINKEHMNKQIQELKNKQKKLNQQLKQKDHTIMIYNQLLVKLRKKLTEKY